MSKEVHGHGGHQRIQPGPDRKGQHDRSHQGYGGRGPQEQGKKQHGKAQNPPGDRWIFHNPRHGPHEEIVASKLAQTFGQGCDQSDGGNHFHEFPGSIQHGAKDCLDASDEASHANDSQQKEKTDADGGGILSENHDSQYDDNAKKVQEVKRGEKSYVFQHKNSCDKRFSLGI